MPKEIRMRDTGKIVNERDFRRSFPNKSLPPVLTKNVLDENGADPVLDSPKPNPGPMYTVKRDGVKRDKKGNWIQKWKKQKITSVYDQERLDQLFNEEKNRIKNQITSTFKEKRDSGVYVDYNGESVRIETDHNAQQEISELVRILEETRGTQKVATRSGVILYVDLPTASYVRQVVIDHVSKCWTRDADLREIVDEAPTFEDLYNIDINSGWPV